MATHAYLRTDDASLFHVEMNLLQRQPGGWFCDNFGGKGRLPALPQLHEGEPVYAVPTTGPILRELLFVLRFPQRLLKLRNKVPLSLEATVDLDLWKLTLTYFGFDEWDVLEDEAREDEPPAKRPRVDAKISAARRAFLREFATTLGARLKDGNRGWPGFKQGVERQLACDYYFRRTGPEAAGQQTISVAGNGARVAVALLAIADKTVLDERLCFADALMEVLSPARSVLLQVLRNGKSNVQPEVWPSTGVVVPTDESAIIMRLVLTHMESD